MDKASEPFDWAHQWYPVASPEDMDPSRPHAISILGRELVLWRDQQGDWRAFEDICPHRLAPLSGAALPLQSPASAASGNLHHLALEWLHRALELDGPEHMSARASAEACTIPRVAC